MRTMEPHDCFDDVVSAARLRGPAGKAVDSSARLHMNKDVYEHDGEEDVLALVVEDAESAVRCEIVAPGRSAKASASRETCFHVATVGAERRGWRRVRRNVEGELDEVSKARMAVRS